MNITRYEPWSVFNLLQRDLNGYSRRQPGLANDESEVDSVADWQPAVDVVEEKTRFVLRADLPGVDPQAITVSMDKGVLSLSGERAREEADEIDGIKRYERRSGKFFRRFTMPESADAEGITAKSANGILQIAIPKQAEVQARQIAVEAA